MRNEATLAVAILAALAAAPALADDRLADLERRVAENDRELADLGAARAPTPTATLAWSYKDVFFVRGEAGGLPFELYPRGLLQTDYRAYRSAPAVRDGFLVRRARVGFEGRFAVFAFQLDADPVRKGLPIGNFWFEYDQLAAAKARFGHFKAPFSVDDGFRNDRFTDMVERPMIVGPGSGLAPHFRPGAMVSGGFGEGLVGCWVAVQNSTDANALPPDDPLVTARLEASALHFTLGGAGAWNRKGARGATSIVGTTPGQFQFFDPVLVHGSAQRYEADLQLYLGPAWLVAEYGWGRQDRDDVLANGEDGAPLVVQGFYATLGWKFWAPPADSPGPHAKLFRDWRLFSSDIVKVRNGRNVGMEVLARLEWVDMEGARRGPGPSSVAPDAANLRGNGARALALGLNFSPVENVRFMLDWFHLRFDDKTRAERAGSHWADELLFRAQLEF